MKPFSLLLLTFPILFFSCNKLEDINPFHEKEKDELPEKICPVISADSIPVSVKDSFSIKFPNQLPSTWFKKNDSTLVAQYILNGKESYISFDTLGNFLGVETEDQENDQDDDDDNDERNNDANDLDLEENDCACYSKDASLKNE